MDFSVLLIVTLGAFIGIKQGLYNIKHAGCLPRDNTNESFVYIYMDMK